MATPDPRGRAMLRAYRNAKAGPAEPHDALWSRIEASLDQGAPGPSLESATAPASAGTVSTITVVVVVAVAVAAVVIAALALSPGDRALGPRQTPSQAPRAAVPVEPGVVAQGDPAVGRVTVEVPTTSSSAAPSDEAEPALARPSRRSTRRSDRDALPSAAKPSIPAVEDPEATDVDELRAELALIREARQALRAQRPAGALEVLDAHARAFPAGQMREDRQVLRIEALCAADKGPQARAEVELFLRAFPSSAHAQRVRTLCPGR